MGERELMHREVLSRRRTLIVGGSLLLLSLLVEGALASLVGWLSIPWLGPAVFAAALVMFAVGFTRHGSTVLRRPTGMFGLIGLAAWTLGLAIFIDPLVVAIENLDPEITVGLVDGIVRGLLALIAVAEIGRAATTPHPWRWAPAWVLAAAAVAWLLTQASATPADQAEYALAIVATGLTTLVQFGGILFLGVLAVIIGALPRNRTVRIGV